MGWEVFLANLELREEDREDRESTLQPQYLPAKMDISRAYLDRGGPS